MAVNYQDSRFLDVEKEEKQALEETRGTYDEIINDSDSHYQELIDNSKKWAEEQSKIQQDNTDFAIDKIEQQKDQAAKDYKKEQKGAYTDYQKATNQYGANAEKLASQGLNATGYSESTRTNAYNTYQNRYATARDSYNRAILNYDNNIKEAQLANNAALAQIAYDALQKQLELSLQSFQYKNTLVLQKLEQLNATKDRYYQRWQDVLSQINTENALAEQIRQYNESLAFQKQQAAQQQANWEKEYALARAKTAQQTNNQSGTEELTQKDDKEKKDDKKSTSGSATLNGSKGGGGGGGGFRGEAKLSAAGEKVLKAAKLAIAAASTTPGLLKKGAVNTTKAIAIDAVNKEYNNGKGSITADDVRIILNKLGV